MTGKEFKEEKAKIQELRSCHHLDQARSLTFHLIKKLFQEYKFARIVELYYSELCHPRESFYTFEVAYALSETDYLDESEKVYEYLLAYEAHNTAILNNLSDIKRAKNQIHEAFELIQHAYQLAPQDEIIAGNYQQLLALIEQQEVIQWKYTEALSILAHEDDALTEQLRTFVSNIYQDPELHNHRMPIPEWKFAILMETDQHQAEMLRGDWLEKGYLRYTGERNRQLAAIYEINPSLKKELQKIHPKRLPVEWIEGFERLTVENLERYSYFSTLRNIRKMNKKYREIAERDLNELFLNYLMQNEKAVVVLAGSLLEIILIDYCEKKNITKLYLPRKNDKYEKRDLYECDLAEMLSYLREKKILSDIFVHIGNISRIYRNFIHPGKELREAELLSQSESNLCFISVMEVIKKLLE